MLLEKINSPKDLKLISIEQLNLVAEEMRKYMEDVILQNGGHLGSANAVIELTIALHFVFDSPKDKIIWDIGHQSYAHKILTGRREAFRTIRKEGGISGFCSIKESEHDIFGAGHSSTSIAALAGFLKCNKLKDRMSIAVIGDSSLASGMAFEGLNLIDHEKDSVGIIVVNDNDTSISPSVGNLRNHLTKIRHSNKISSIDNLRIAIDRLESMPNENIFTCLGYNYLGVIPGHNIEMLVELFTALRDKKLSKTTIVHIETKKDSHATPAHGAAISLNTYTKTLSMGLIDAIKEDNSICCISAAMTAGTGLDMVECHFPNNVIDAGISEQAAVTMSAAMSIAGKKPLLAIYSTFLQRAYDQIIHDVALQKLPVRIMIDRGGCVGEDGPTHNGAFDLAFLRIIPNLIVMSPRNGAEMIRMLKTSIQIDNCPSVVRYSKYGDAGDFATSWENVEPCEIGKGTFLQKGSRCCLIGIGHIVNSLVTVANNFVQNHSIKLTVFDARFVKPIDVDALMEICKHHDVIISAEDGCAGGLGSAILEQLAMIEYKGSFYMLTQPDKFLPHGKVSDQHTNSKLDLDSIASFVQSMLGIRTPTKTQSS